MWSLKPVTYDTQEHERVPSMVPAHTVCTDDHQLRLLLHIVLQLPLQVFPTMCKIIQFLIAPLGALYVNIQQH